MRKMFALAAMTILVASVASPGAQAKDPGKARVTSVTRADTPPPAPPAPAAPDTNTPAAHPQPPLIDAGLNDSITFHVSNLGEWKAAFETKPKIVPYINGLAIHGNYPMSVNAAEETITFRLQRVGDWDTDNLDAWATLLHRPGLNEKSRLVSATVGTEDGREVLPFDKLESAGNLKLILLPWWWWFLALLVLAMLAALFYLAAKSDLLRDSDLEPFNRGERKPFSLSRTQMAVWFVLILGAYAALWAITGQHGYIPETVLGLMGISGGTAVAAVAIDANRREARQKTLTEARKKLEDQIALLLSQIATVPPNVEILKAELQLTQEKLNTLNPRSRGFFLDVLSDDDGVGFHRFQILAWTAMISFVFIATVYNTLSMPKFTTTLLGLMGLSAGTYLGFKLPEKKT